MKIANVEEFNRCLAANQSTYLGANQSTSNSTVLLTITISNTGPLGATMKRSHGGSAFIQIVKDGSLGNRAGLQASDVLVSNGEDVQYDTFLEMCKGTRPIVFKVRRRVDSSPNTC